MNGSISFSHGGDIYSRKIIYDFSANINPLGMPEGVKKALINGFNDFEHYPDTECAKLRRAIAERDGAEYEKIVCGNGAADLIYRIVQAFRPQRALVCAPTFSEYERALISSGCEVARYYTNTKDNFSLRDDIIEFIDSSDIVFLCNPNNPVGNLIQTALLKKIIRKCAECGALLVIDESFIEFTGEKPLSPAELSGNVILLRAFTKIYAMPGLRLGYIICSQADTAKKIKYCGQCWSVSVPAQIAGVAALEEQGFIEQTVELIKKERGFLADSLKKSGFEVFDSKANFILFRCGLPLDRILLRKGIAIRDCFDYHGLSAGYFRIAVRTREENIILVNAINEAVLNG